MLSKKEETDLLLRFVSWWGGDVSELDDCLAQMKADDLFKDTGSSYIFDFENNQFDYTRDELEVLESRKEDILMLIRLQNQNG